LLQQEQQLKNKIFEKMSFYVLIIKILYINIEY